MDYEKLYKEALERARDLHNNHSYSEPPQWITCEKIFPELCESEDEKIRKELIQHLKELSKVKDLSHTPIKFKQFYDVWIAWLEKQGEHNPTWSEEDDYVYNEILKRVADKKLYEHDLEYIYTWLKSLKPQPRWKPTGEQMRVLQTAIRDYGISHEKSILESLYNNLKKL